MTERPPYNARSFLVDEGKKWLARVVFLGIGAGVLSLLTPLGHTARAIWQSPERLEAIDTQLTAILDRLDQMSGEKRVIRQPDGMSFVREPVTVGEPIALVLYVGRTEVGEACVLREIIPAFTDENDVQRAGLPTRPMRQLSVEVQRVVVDLDQPSGLIPGRTRVTLQLEYLCGTRTVFETTQPVFYYALPVA